MPIIQHGGILVDAHPIGVCRPNLRAAGATKTLERKKERDEVRKLFGLPVSKLSDEALRICVRGTTDRLAGGLTFKTTRKVCSCCGSKVHGKLMLNDNGRARLSTLLRRRARRLVA